jgi:hypothetical protein
MAVGKTAAIAAIDLVFVTVAVAAIAYVALQRFA